MDKKEMDKPKIKLGPLKVRGIAYLDVSSVLNKVRQAIIDDLYDFDEKEFKQKSSGGRWNFEIEHTGNKKVTSFIEHNVNVKYFIMDTKDVEVKIEGKTKKLQKARIDILISGSVDVDPRDLIKGKFYEFLRNFYYGVLYKPYLENYHAAEITKLLYKIQDIIKRESHFEAV